MKSSDMGHVKLRKSDGAVILPYVSANYPEIRAAWDNDEPVSIQYLKMFKGIDFGKATSNTVIVSLYDDVTGFSVRRVDSEGASVVSYIEDNCEELEIPIRDSSASFEIESFTLDSHQREMVTKVVDIFKNNEYSIIYEDHREVAAIDLAKEIFVERT